MRSPEATPLAEPLRRLPSGKAAGSFRLPYRSLVGTAAGIGCLVAAVLLARDQLAAAATQLANEHGLPLFAAALCAPVVPAATACAWRSVLASRDIALTRAEAWGCYGLGSVANTFLPGRAGDALRIELFARRLDHAKRRWLACSVATSVGLAQSVVFGLVLVGGSVAGALPIWVIAPFLGVPVATWIGARVARPHERGPLRACVVTAALLSRLAWARLLAWAAAAAAARLLLVIAVLEALEAPHPVAAAFVAACGLAAGKVVPFAPGAAGVGAATMSVALGHAGLEPSTAIAAAVSFHALETAASLLFGASGWLMLRLGALAAGRAPALAEHDLARAS